MDFTGYKPTYIFIAKFQGFPLWLVGLSSLEGFRSPRCCASSDRSERWHKECVDLPLSADAVRWTVWFPCVPGRNYYSSCICTFSFCYILILTDVGFCLIHKNVPLITGLKGFYAAKVSCFNDRNVGFLPTCTILRFVMSGMRCKKKNPRHLAAHSIFEVVQLQSAHLFGQQTWHSCLLPSKHL